jgi:DNA invertase Pin-like site-specific DNA recombinase
MRVLYVRVSSIQQNLERQISNKSDFDLIIEDKCSGSVPFFDRVGGKEIKSYLDRNLITSLHVHQIDRLGRNLRDILNTIHFFNELKIPIFFIKQGLRTIDDDGKENTISKLMISILATVGEMERNQIRERQLEGIELAKKRGVYLGRKKGTKENMLNFLNKPKNKKAFELLEKGYKNIEVAKISGLHPNTITKIKKLSSQLN